ncbi:MAG: hypothetical protein D6819_00990 [Gammaproteobacteria bacterium]|nr:MAG: hypothetical protein D6819_00990 [Gammaproteobacteria bacterium]
MVLLALSLSSAVLLGLALLGYHLKGRWPNEISPKTWSGSAFVPLQGRGRPEGDALHLDFKKRALLLLGGLSLNAQAYPFISLDFEPWPPGMKAYAVWRTSGQPRLLHMLQLPWGTQFIRVAAHPRWEGRITDIGLFFRGEGKATLRIHRLSLIPLAPSALLKGIWSEWTAFEGLNPRSVNFVVGGVRHPIVSPVVAAAAWVGTTWLLSLFLVFIRRMPWEPALFSLAFLLGWLALDARWQWDLLRQLHETHDRFAGEEPRALSQQDARLLAFMEEVKAKLPSTPQRIFLVTSDPQGKDRYARLRAFYHLLPHNVYYHLDAPPAPEWTRPGDYILILGRMPGVRHEQGVLRWDHEEIPVEPVLTSSLGQLYRVR